ncbi:hypothetical protein vBBak6_057 [Bacillus phage v_B-Bak6]|uniref:Uncharacterized protein n=1 Tax=Bacillus phage Basilisk TaxID=1296654 RepID=S5MLU9_9CAUD|nr:hypothetical protein PP653_gp102 [Bacillus phage Basilisk]AGR46610.1 hypothetical protein BASILISK_65 [Bacillus phage Basilisk]AXY83017.1 hypothetical protein vBBak1_057 [Bacillus phage v_B-Bak1]AXY83137.1 hypothetical protein vBBak6_057 [Bacillus phage v_B-Bak6]
MKFKEGLYMECDAIVNNKKCKNDATHIGTVLTKESRIIEVLACKEHAKRSGFFGEELLKEEQQ